MPHSSEPARQPDLPDSDRPADTPKGKRVPPGWIFAGLGAGVFGGLGANALLGSKHPFVQSLIANVAEPVGQLFLRLLLLLVVPLVFSSLLLGVAGLGEIRKLGRIGLKSLIYCLLISSIAVALALVLTNLVQPGRRVNPKTQADLRGRYSTAASMQIQQARDTGPKDSPLVRVVKTLVPRNPIASVADENPNMLHLMCFSLLLGVGVLLVPSAQAAAFQRVIEGLYAICSRLLDVVMWLAPAAVACLVFTNLALFGLDLLQALGWFMLTVLGGLALHLFGTYAIMLRWASRLSPIDFFRRIRLVMLTAFSTSSSNATLPTTLRVSEEQLGVPRQIGSFVLTVGATANQNGTALYEGVTVLFLAQLAGLDLSWPQQALVAYLAVLGSIGTAGLPSASIPFIVLVITQLGINPELIAIILGADRFLDMCRTVVNVTGDLTAATYVARSEGFQLPGMRGPNRGP